MKASLKLLPLAVLCLAAGPNVQRERVSQNQIGPTYQSWHPASLFTGGTSLVTFDQPDRRGKLGSLEQVLPEPGGPAFESVLQIFAEDVILIPGEGWIMDDGFGRLADLRRASYRWMRRPESTTLPFLASAMRLIVHDPDANNTWALIYEPAYNGYLGGVPVDRWVRSNVAKSFVWRTPLYLDGVPAPAGWCRGHPSECYRYNLTPRDWGFGPETKVIGLQLAVGSGWPGTYWGYVDNVKLRFRKGRRYVWNFEPL